MKRLSIIMLLAVFSSCSEENEPEFKIEGGLFLQSRFDAFVEIAESEAFNKTVPRKNLILRFVSPNTDSYNDSRSYMKDGQLYVDIDEFFITNLTNNDHTIMIVFQELAHALYDTPFRDCGIMKKVNSIGDLPPSPNWGYGDYPVLFDSEAPCWASFFLFVTFARVPTYT